MNGKPQINVQIGEKESEGVYSNLVLISHSASEFVLDFARALPGAPRARVHARVIMTPLHAKALHRTLEQNLKRFEETHGAIPSVDKEAKGEIGFQSGGATAAVPDGGDAASAPGPDPKNGET